MNQENIEKDFNPKEIINIVIQFRIPFAIDVLNSINSETGTPYDVFIDDIPAQLRFERIYDFKYKGDGTDISPFCKIDNDRYGILSHTKVLIIWDKRILNKIDISPEDLWMSSEVFMDLGLEYINKFLDAYRDVSQQFWVKRIIKRNIFNYSYKLIDKEGGIRDLLTLIPQHNPVESSGGKEFQLEKEKDETLRKMLQTEYFSFRNELILDIDDNINLENYNIALLQAVIRFENFVYSQLKKRDISNSMLNKYKKNKECECHIGINEVCKNLFKEKYGIDFENTEEYKNLYEYAIKIRNKIIHGDITENIGQETSIKGINAVGYAEKYLIENIFTEVLETGIFGTN